MWLLYACLTAVANAAYGLEQKRISKKAHPIWLSFLTRLWSLPIIVGVYVVLNDAVKIQTGFWLYLFICSTLTSLGTYLTYVAYRYTDFSLVFPMLNLTPAIALLTAWCIDGDKSNVIGLIGVILVVGGSILLTTYGKVNLKQPAKHVMRDKGVWAILTVAVLYAITTSYDKLGVAASSPVVWSLGLNVAMIFILIPFIFLIPKGKSRKVKKPTWSVGVAAGCLVALTMLFQMFALQSGGHVAYVLAIKQLSVIIAVVASYKVLREKPDATRWWSTVIMTVGAIIIGLA